MTKGLLDCPATNGSLFALDLIVTKEERFHSVQPKEQAYFAVRFHILFATK